MKQTYRKKYFFPVRLLLFLLLPLLLLLAVSVILYMSGRDANRAAQQETVEEILPQVPDMQAEPYISPGPFYYDETEQAVLERMQEQEIYTRVLRCVTRSGDIQSSDELTIDRQKACYRAVSQNGMQLFYDGKTLVLEQGKQKLYTETASSCYGEELGLLTLESLQKMAAQPEIYPMTLTRGEDPTVLLVEVDDPAHDLRTVCEVQVETGLVSVERTYRDGVLYRIVWTESVQIYHTEVFEPAVFCPQDGG